MHADMTQQRTTKKLAMAGVLTALATIGSMISFPVAGSQCAPVQHMVNILAAVTLGPWWGTGIAFCASLLRNLLGIGSLMAFPGSMIGALCCGVVYAKWRRLGMTCIAEALGTGILGTFPDFYDSREHPGLSSDHRSGKRRSHETDLGINKKQIRQIEKWR